MRMLRGLTRMPPARDRLTSLLAGPVQELARYIPDFSFEFLETYVDLLKIEALRIKWMDGGLMRQSLIQTLIARIKAA